jgi:DNA processing protein
MNRPRPASNSPDAAHKPWRLTLGSLDWPEELDELGGERPAGLWAQGSATTLSVAPRVAIVGTRRATEYGMRVTRALAEAFARAGACIVSGMARGIDGAAHQAALDAGGTTIGVLGTGLARVFPSAHRQLQSDVVKRGLLLSELEHEETGAKWNFPRRNRIIAALAKVTIVVEAPIKSGALITADHATKLNRTVACVPGQIDQPQSEGSNRLMRDGAGIVTSVEEALSLAGLTPPLRTPRGDPDGNEGRVWRALADGGLHIDTLCTRSGLPAPECLAAVTTLELAGSVECALTGEIRRR